MQASTHHRLALLQAIAWSALKSPPQALQPGRIVPYFNE